MIDITVTDRVGIKQLVHGELGKSLMEVLRENAIDEIMARCGGICSCATCHVIVDPQFAGSLPRMSDDERDLLETSEHRQETSRLSCQIVLDSSFGGFGITIAPED